MQLGLLAAVFLLPPMVAYVLFFVDFRPAVGGNYGDLITPARPMQDLALKTMDGRSFQLSELKQKWTLLYVGGRQCGDTCGQNLYKINQVRLAQGKNIKRVSSVFIAPESMSAPEVDEIARKYPNILILLAGPDVFMTLWKQLGGADGQVLHGPEQVYIVDPLGNLMMSYQTGIDPDGIRKDLKKLLKLSQIG